MNPLSILFVCLVCATLVQSVRVPGQADRSIELMDVFVTTPTNTDPSSFINAALDAVESSEVPDFANACTLSSATTVVATNQGSFGVCIESFQATVKFFGLNGRNVALAAFTDGEVDMYGTNKVLNGNMCNEVYDKIGKACFAQAAGLVAQTYLPVWKNLNNQTSSTVANFIGTTFSPQVTTYPGVIGRCYFNSGKFTIVGLGASSARNALKVRDSKYNACEISEGDPRWWASASWSYQRIGSLLVGGGALIVGLLIPCLSCCL